MNFRNLDLNKIPQPKDVSIGLPQYAVPDVTGMFDSCDSLIWRPGIPFERKREQKNGQKASYRPEHYSRLSGNVSPSTEILRNIDQNAALRKPDARIGAYSGASKNKDFQIIENGIADQNDNELISNKNITEELLNVESPVIRQITHDLKTNQRDRLEKVCSSNEENINDAKKYSPTGVNKTSMLKKQIKPRYNPKNYISPNSSKFDIDFGFSDKNQKPNAFVHKQDDVPNRPVEYEHVNLNNLCAKENKREYDNDAINKNKENCRPDSRPMIEKYNRKEMPTGYVVSKTNRKNYIDQYKPVEYGNNNEHTRDNTPDPHILMIIERQNEHIIELQKTLNLVLTKVFSENKPDFANPAIDYKKSPPKHSIPAQAPHLTKTPKPSKAIKKISSGTQTIEKKFRDAGINTEIAWEELSNVRCSCSRKENENKCANEQILDHSSDEDTLVPLRSDFMQPLQYVGNTEMENVARNEHRPKNLEAVRENESSGVAMYKNVTISVQQVLQRNEYTECQSNPNSPYKDGCEKPRKLPSQFNKPVDLRRIVGKQALGFSILDSVIDNYKPDHYNTFAPCICGHAQAGALYGQNLANHKNLPTENDFSAATEQFLGKYQVK